MSTAVLTGSPTPVSQLQPPSLDYTERGWTATIPYEDVASTSGINRILAIANAAYLSGARVSVKQSYGKVRVESVYPWDFSGGSGSPATEFVPLWEMISKKAEVSIFDWKNPLAANVDLSNIAYAKNVIQNISTYNINGGNPSGKALAWPDSGTKTAALELLSLYVNDVTSYNLFVPELHFTQTVNSQYVFPASFSNTGRIYSSTTLKSVFSVPGNILFGFPIASSIPSYISSFNLVYGWFTNGPEVRQIAQFKWQIIQTFEWGLWSTDMYWALL